MSDKRVCCICGKDMTNEFPNNPWPFGEPEEDACAACNSNYVTPIRGWISAHNINEAVKLLWSTMQLSYLETVSR